MTSDPLSNEEIARAISGHRFDAAYPYLDDEVTWTLVGESRLEGKAAFIGACESTAAALKGASTEFRELRAIAGAGRVVIESVATYTAVDGSRTEVASCDVYRFRAGRLTEATSYNILLTEGP